MIDKLNRLFYFNYKFNCCFVSISLLKWKKNIWKLNEFITYKLFQPCFLSFYYIMNKLTRKIIEIKLNLIISLSK